MSRRALLALLSLLPGLVSAAEFPTFERVVLDPEIGKVCYAVSVADVNGDEKPDVVAVTENRVLWFEAPDWKPRTIVADATQPDNVCIAPHDVDGDGQVDFALGAGWLNGKNTGTIQWLSRGKTLDEPWSVHLIGEIPWTHRMRWADVLGTGTPQLVVSPLNKSGEDEGARLTAFSIPENPRTDRWEQTVLDATLNKVHNHWHDVDAKDGKTLTLTASEEGLHVFIRVPLEIEGKKSELFGRAKLPKSEGAGEVKVGSLGGDERFTVSIEPMHGTKVVVYPLLKTQIRRFVIEEQLGRGHALWTADVDGDGIDEIVVGHSEPGTGDVKGPGIYVYKATDATGIKWTKHVIDDGGIATEDLIATDLTGDGKVDIVAGGRETHNLVLYVQKPEARSTKSETNPKSE